MQVREPKLIAAEGAAYFLIESCGISSAKEIVLEDIALSEGVTILDGGIQGAEARLARVGDKGIIRVRAGIAESGRRRFAVAHEMGHWKLHQNDSQWQFCAESDIRENEIRSYTESPLEIEANAFASELLMPTFLFRPRAEQVEPDLELIKVLAAEFDVTLTAAALRFVDESDAACMVVFSKNGKVAWWRRSSRAERERVWIDKDWPISADTLAFQCHKNEPVPPDGIKGEASDWFGEEIAERIGGVVEQSMLLGRYSTVLTLLSVG
jgi:Zn-dependent peptidase ImmA (M78 family)